MTEDIYIVAGGTCEVNLDVEGEYILTCASITGRLAITCVDKDNDYITYISDETTGTTRTVKPRLSAQSTVSSGLIPIISNFTCEKKDDGLFYYKYQITDCSERLGYVLGLKNLPTKAGDQFQASPSLNGPTFFQVTCDKLTGSGTVTANTYIINSMFQLSGPSYVGDISNVSFSIRGVYNELIEFNEDLLWHFQLTKLPPRKQGEDKKQHNAEVHIVHQYGK